jgi:uracil-DNA glycosylase family 4
MPDPAPTPLSKLALLTWYLDAGVDETIGEQPVNRYAALQKSQGPVQVQAPVPGVAGQPQAPLQQATFKAPNSQQVSQNGQNDSIVENAYALAKAAESIDDLRAALEKFEGCALQKTATNLVFTDGNPKARLMMVGEAPGAEEDRQGAPFVGPSGKLVDQMLASIGLDREQVLICNTVFWRPPGNRSPTTQEIAICLPFLERLIELVDPEILVPVGGPASTTLLAQQKGITKLRGNWFSYASSRMASPIPATPLLHPAYLLRSPAQKREVWKDLLAIRQKLDEA